MLTFYMKKLRFRDLEWFLKGHTASERCNRGELMQVSVYSGSTCSEVVKWIYLFLRHTGEKAMAPHSSTLAWKIPWVEEPGGLQSMGSLRVGHDWATSLSLFSFMHRRRKWQPTPVFLPGESQGRGSLVGCRLWGRTESDTLQWLSSKAYRGLTDYGEVGIGVSTA